MSLDTVIPLIEARLEGQAGGFVTRVNEGTNLDDHDAVRLEGTYEKDGTEGLLGLIVTKLDDTFLLTVTFRASVADFEELRPQFDSFTGSIDLRLDSYQR